MTTEQKKRPRLSPIESRKLFEKRLVIESSVESLELIDKFSEACAQYNIKPNYGCDGASVMYYYFHSKDTWSKPEKFNLLQINVRGEVVGTRFLQIQCSHNNVQLDDSIWVNHWNGLGRITGCGSLVPTPTTVPNQHQFRCPGNTAPSMMVLFGESCENIGKISEHLSVTASSIKKALS
jgi:hypothetical protein